MTLSELKRAKWKVVQTDGGIFLIDKTFPIYEKFGNIYTYCHKELKILAFIPLDLFITAKTTPAQRKSIACFEVLRRKKEYFKASVELCKLKEEDFNGKSVQQILNLCGKRAGLTKKINICDY